MKNETTAKRLVIALDRAGLKAQELANKTGISKASISQYVNGTHAPSNESAGKMAEVLGVSPVWLMGYDVPMEILSGDNFDFAGAIRPLTDEEKRLLKAYRNALQGRREAVRALLNMDVEEI